MLVKKKVGVEIRGNEGPGTVMEIQKGTQSHVDKKTEALTRGGNSSSWDDRKGDNRIRSCAVQTSKCYSYKINIFV